MTTKGKLGGFAIVWHRTDVPRDKLGFGAHIGLLPLGPAIGAAVLAWTKDEPIPDLAPYDVFMVNMFDKSLHQVEAIRRIRPEAKIILSPDIVPEKVFHKDEKHWPCLDMLGTADVIGYRAKSNRQVYCALTGKPGVWAPVVIGHDKFFEKCREQKKEDFIIAASHSWSASPGGTVGALAVIQRETGLRVVWCGGKELEQRLAALAGLDVEWRDYMVYEDYVRLAAKARLGVDLYASHSVGRNELTLAYAGTPSIGSMTTEAAVGLKFDPMDGLGAGEAGLKLLNNKLLYDAIRQQGIRYVQRQFAFDAVKAYYEQLIEKVRSGKLAA